MGGGRDSCLPIRGGPPCCPLGSRASPQPPGCERLVGGCSAVVGRVVNSFFVFSETKRSCLEWSPFRPNGSTTRVPVGVLTNGRFEGEGHLSIRVITYTNQENDVGGIHRKGLRCAGSMGLYRRLGNLKEVDRGELNGTGLLKENGRCLLAHAARRFFSCCYEGKRTYRSACVAGESHH